MYIILAFEIIGVPASDRLQFLAARRDQHETRMGEIKGSLQDLSAHVQPFALSYQTFILFGEFV